MSSPVDQPSTTSYSDPIYDRLELLAQQFRRRVALYLSVIVVIVVGFVVAHQVMQDTPLAGSAAAFMKAGDEQDATKRADGFRALVDNPAIAPLFRARAALELAQEQLNAGKPTDAATQVNKAAEIAALADNADLNLAVQLSRAAVELQSGDAAKAEDTYAKAERAAGAKYPDRKLAAELGQALALEKQNKIADAIAKLEPVISRTDSAAKNLLDIARVSYWRMKREQAEPAAPAVPTLALPSVPALPAAPAAPTVPAVPAIK